MPVIAPVALFASQKEFAATQALLVGSELPASSTPTLAVEWRGENGIERLENRMGNPLRDLIRAEADEWIDRLTPDGRE